MADNVRIERDLRDFENWARRLERQLSDIPALAVERLANEILSNAFEPGSPMLRGAAREPSGAFRGPGGRFLSTKENRVERLPQYEATARAAARAVLYLSPRVGFRTIKPVTKRALAFEWIGAPPAVRDKQPLFPLVFFRKVTVPYIIKLTDEEFDEMSRDAFTSAEFREWLGDMFARGLVSHQAVSRNF